MGDCVEPDAVRVPAVRRGRGERRGRRLPRQALRHGERARRLSRSARRQGADRLDLRLARHRRRAAALAGDPGGVARPADRRRRDVLMAGRQAGRREAASGVEAQHRRAAPAGRAGARRARFRFRRRLGADRPDGGGAGADAALGRGLSARMGASHGRQRRRIGTARTLATAGCYSARSRSSGTTGQRDDTDAPDDLLGADVRRRRAGAVDPARDPAAVRRRHGARLSARSARQPAGAMGVNRLVATLVIIGAVVLAFVLLMLLFVPILAAQLGAFFENSPATCRALQSLVEGPEPRVAAQDRRRERARRAGRRPGQAGRRLDHDLRQVAVVGRAGADLRLLARRRDAGGGVLSAVRLEPDGRRGQPHGCAPKRDEVGRGRGEPAGSGVDHHRPRAVVAVDVDRALAQGPGGDVRANQAVGGTARRQVEVVQRAVGSHREPSERDVGARRTPAP